MTEDGGIEEQMLNKIDAWGRGGSKMSFIIFT